MSAATASRAVRAAEPARARRGFALPLALWLAGALISGFTLRRNIGPLDEGILMQAATRMGDGQWPWRDFSWAYGPGEPLAAMAAAKLLGPSLLWWRLLRVAADATAALLVWALVRDARPRWALAAWAAAAVTAAQPASANPAGPALAFALGAVLLASRRHPAWAGAAAAAAVFWRPDVGAAAALAAAATAALAAREGARGASSGVAGGGPSRGASSGGVGRGPAGRSAGGLRAALVALVSAVAVGAVLYLPFAIAAGPERLWDALVAQATRDGAWWRLPFPDAFHGSDALDFLRWLLPYAALAALVVAAARARRSAPSVPSGNPSAPRSAPSVPSGNPSAPRSAPSRAGLLILALGATAYFLSRADEEHAQTLLVLVTAIAAIAEPRIVLGAVLGLILVTGAGNRASALVRAPDLATLHLDGAGGVQVTHADAGDLPKLAARVRELTDGPIYVAPRRSDLVTFSDPLLHYLVGRPNVLHRDVLLQARPEEQAKIVAALRRARPLVIRWTDPASSKPEPNRRGRPSGSRALDDYLNRAYREDSRFGAYVVLVPR